MDEPNPSKGGEAQKGEVVDAPRVDLNLDEFIELRVQLGGQVFIAREASIEVQKRIVEAMPDRAEEQSREQSLATLQSIYPQLAQLLRHADGTHAGKPPAREFLEEHLPMSGLQKLMDALNTTDDEESPRGKP